MFDRRILFSLDFALLSVSVALMGFVESFNTILVWPRRCSLPTRTRLTVRRSADPVGVHVGHQQHRLRHAVHLHARGADSALVRS
jgi:hypothetical protein